MNAQTEVPEHIEPRSLSEMSSDEIEQLLVGIRERRLSAAKHYEAAVAAKKQAEDDKTREMLQKQLDMTQKALDSADKAIERLEQRIMKVRALRLQLGID